MTSNLPATMTGLVASLETAVTTVSLGSGDIAFLKMLKTGSFVYGSDETEVAENSVWAVNPQAFAMGFQAWGLQGSSDEGELLGEEMALVSELPVIKGNLPDVGAPWKQMLSMQLACIEGDDKGLVLQYGTTSKGGIKAVNGLMQALVKRIKDPKADGKFVPVIVLEDEFYKHKKYGRIYTPIFTIEKWIDLADAMPAAPGETQEDADDYEPPKKASRKKAVAEEVEDEDDDLEEDAPKPRRSRAEPEEVGEEEDEDDTPPPVRRRRRA